MEYGKKKKKDDSNRRAFLKRTATASAAFTMPTIGSAAASEQNQSEAGTASASGRVAENTVTTQGTRRTRGSREAFVNAMREKYGQEAVAPIDDRSEMSISSAIDSADIDGTRIDDAGCDGSVSVENGYGDTVVSADFIIDMYETDNYDGSSGDRRYFYHHWASAQSHNHSYFKGNIWSFTNSIDFSNGDLKWYKPEQNYSTGGIPVDLKLKISGKSKKGVKATAIGKTSFDLLSGTFQVKGSETSIANDEYAVWWEGDREGQQTVTGLSAEQRPSTSGWDYNYNFELTGGMYKKTA
ncbi:hypothetical protein [Halorussus sp. MSC15.2]|uniref:hypothetical protein n=1 Tax=Halorussus sp. MSC15.2 TaxID=2283638 RepID=UPI0013D33E1A|nr:hypothetical protein [Halorussus sp. MSC15.2]NEU55399.1 hypothetical protein [Halorussus sp. MSC15.2]